MINGQLIGGNSLEAAAFEAFTPQTLQVRVRMSVELTPGERGHRISENLCLENEAKLQILHRSGLLSVRHSKSE